jgi:hypothetical protein
VVRGDTNHGGEVVGTRTTAEVRGDTNHGNTNHGGGNKNPKGSANPWGMENSTIIQSF